jgi:hypothetical protein
MARRGKEKIDTYECIYVEELYSHLLFIQLVFPGRLQEVYNGLGATLRFRFIFETYADARRFRRFITEGPGFVQLEMSDASPGRDYEDHIIYTPTTRDVLNALVKCHHYLAGQEDYDVDYLNNLADLLERSGYTGVARVPR